MTPSITYLAGEYEALEQLINALKLRVNISSILFGVALWAFIGFVIAGHAKKYGLNGGVHFCLCFFLRIFGLVPSLILIDKRKKQLCNPNTRNYNPYYDQPQNYGQPYDQIYGSGVGYGQGQPQRIEQPNYGQQMYTGNAQYGQQTYVQNGYGQQFVYDYDIKETMRAMEEQNDPNDIRMFGISNGTYVCPRCHTVQDMGGRCLICDEKIN